MDSIYKVEVVCQGVKLSHPSGTIFRLF